MAIGFLGGRRFKTVVAALFQQRHYLAAMRMMKVYHDPSELFRRYLMGSGAYPFDVRIRTPLGDLTVTTYHKEDILTVNEVFCRHDYVAGNADRVFVDFGSNIGVSAAYFLSRNRDSYAYLFEPLPQNTQRLRQNLLPFSGRFCLREVAVGLANGTVDFGWEPSGRLGGIGKDTGSSMRVACMDSNEVLEEVLNRHGTIDVLKIDIETFENDIVSRIPVELAQRIRRVYVEYTFQTPPLVATHRHVKYGQITRFYLKD